MVVSTKIQCVACDASFYIKYQMDYMIKLYPWNLDFCCPECGDRIHLTIGSKGLNYKHSDKEDFDQAYVIGYSSSLPITKALFLPYTNREQRMVSFSPFMNLSMFYGLHSIQAHGSFIRGIFLRVFEYKNSLLELLPILKKDNMKPEAYTRKMMNVFGIKKSKRGLS